MLDNEIQIWEQGSHFVDVAHIECILIQRPDGWPFVHVDVLDS